MLQYVHSVKAEADMPAEAWMGNEGLLSQLCSDHGWKLTRVSTAKGLVQATIELGAAKGDDAKDVTRVNAEVVCTEPKRPSGKDASSAARTAVVLEHVEGDYGSLSKVKLELDILVNSWAVAPK